MSCPEAPRTDSEPFITALDETRVSDTGTRFAKLANFSNLIVRAEQLEGIPANPDIPTALAKQKAALIEFAQVSGLKVAPYWDIIGQSVCSEDVRELAGIQDSMDNFKTAFHVVTRIRGYEVYESESGLPSLQISPRNASRLANGILEYYIDAYAHNKPHVYEIRPAQFMFGITDDDLTPDFYMVDVDYALSNQTGMGTVYENICYLINYIVDYGPDEAFRTCADRMLSMLDHPDMHTWIAGSYNRLDDLAQSKIDLLDYLDTLDHQ